MGKVQRIVEPSQTNQIGAHVVEIGAEFTQIYNARIRFHHVPIGHRVHLVARVIDKTIEYETG